MHVAKVKSKTLNKAGEERVYESVLLRRSYRVGARVKHEALPNLSALPKPAIEACRASLAGKTPIGAGDGLKVTRSLPHGHVAAVTAQARALNFPALLGPASRNRDVALALIIARACRPGSKLFTTRWWEDTTLATDFDLVGISTDEVYSAMDWLGNRQGSIEKKLARRLLSPDVNPKRLALFDLSSSWVTGTHCPLAARGYSRDGKKGLTQIEYGLLTDPDGRPVAIRVVAGNTADPTALEQLAIEIKRTFGVEDMVMVGDRDMITTARIDQLRDLGGLGWVTALRTTSIAALTVPGGPLQQTLLGYPPEWICGEVTTGCCDGESCQTPTSCGWSGQMDSPKTLFDETNLAEISNPAFPGERLIACSNPALAASRAHKRIELLSATEATLTTIVAAVQAGRLKKAGPIGIHVGKVVGRYNMNKHFILTITDGHFSFVRNQASIDAEAALDGIYVIRTSVLATDMNSATVVTTYKSLARVERDFRSIKSIDLDLRPIHHWTEPRVRAHVFLCMLAAHLVWHLRQARAPLTFTDENRPEPTDPVAPAKRSTAAQHKASTRLLSTGKAAQSFTALLNHLATLTRNHLHIASQDTTIGFDLVATPTPTQRRAFAQFLMALDT